MMNLTCTTENRRMQVRDSHFNGLDYLEVSDDQRNLTVFFLGKAPEGLKRENVRLTGGRRVREVRVTAIEIIASGDSELDDQLIVKVNQPGDFSSYSLSLVALDEEGRPTDQPFPGFDPRYACLDFSFKAGCASDLDCQPQDVCPPEPRPAPEINYLAKDYGSFRQLLLDRLSLLMPDWKERHVPDLGIALVELLAYTGDYLSYYQDAVATEAYLDTARQRISVRRHARLVDYRMHEGCNARTWVCLQTNRDREIDPNDFYFITGQALPVPDHVLSTNDLAHLPHSRYEVFEPLGETPIQLYAAHNRISFYTWGDGAEGGTCCLPKGATSATLKDERKPERKLHLQAGDVLIFEEILGPRTGHPADADPTHRHAVRLTRTTSGVDPLNDQPVLEIEWTPEDALPFSVCISTTSAPPKCNPLADVSIACGNVILAGHGRRISDEDLGEVPARDTEEDCPTPCRPPDVRVIPGRFRPSLKEALLTFSQPLTPHAPASTLLRQNPRAALPWIQAHAFAPPGKPDPKEKEPKIPPVCWTPQFDLLASGADDDHFVVEMDSEGRAHVRFGDDELGKQPEAHTRFTATYRVGNGPAGNVGVGALSHIVFRQPQSGAEIQPCNPLPAQGGTAPESIQEVKLFAPHAFRRLERAILPEDYAAIVLRDFSNHIQRAAATLRWMGSGYEVLVVIDPKGNETADPTLLKAIAGHLHRYRRIGHDLSVQTARYVPLEVKLTVCVQPGYLRSHVKAALLNVLSNRSLPDGKLGFFHPDNLTFGEGVYLSKLVGAVQAVSGVESVNVNSKDIQLERLFEGPNGEIENGVLPIGPLEIARLDNDLRFPENGKLTLNMRGGR